MHAIGFYHEQSRYDRNDYVDVFLDNVMENNHRNFEIQTADNITHCKTEYDFKSVMHYGTKDFSKNGLDTIRPKQPHKKIERNGLSEIDKLEINRLYKCPNYVPCDEIVGNILQLERYK